MESELVLLEVRGTVAVVTINRPDKLNALNEAVLDALDGVLTRIESNDEVRVVVITGAGEKAFVAGADIGEIARKDPMEARAMALKGQGLLNRIEQFSRPVIASVNGFALGGGCEIAMACHIRLASSRAKLGQPEVKLGIIPGYAGTQRLPRLVGKGHAMELILSGKMISAQEAERIDLVNHVYEPETLMEETMKLATEIASQAPVAVRLAMESINHGLEVPFDRGCFLEAHTFATLFATEDMKEGTAAFLEKREAQFKGK